MNNTLIEYDDSTYVVSPCNGCPKKNTNACNNCSRKRTEPKKCDPCSNTKVKCGCSSNKTTCTTNRSVCKSSDYFAVLNYFSELVHEWEKDLAKFNLGIQELESINYLTEETADGSYLNKVLFVFRKGHELITKEFNVAPKGPKGDKFTWEDFTEDLINLLKGAKGDPGKDGETPILNQVLVTFTENPNDISGEFQLIGNTNVYKMLLVLPKQHTYQEYLTIIQTALNDSLATINARIDLITPFDFSNLSLRLDGTLLKLVYDGDESSAVTLNIPELNLYSLQRTQDPESSWEDTIDLLKNGLVISSIEYAKRFKPKDWWIVSNPSVIVMYNGEIKFKTINIKAFSSYTGEVVCVTDQEAGLDDKSFTIFVQSSSTKVDTIRNGQHVWEGHWRDISFLYNSSTGVLSLPENGYTTQYNGETIKFDYRSGDFIWVTLYCNDSRPRRVTIPIIDIEDIWGNINHTDDDTVTTYTDFDPNLIPDSVTHCYLRYTVQYENCDLTMFYNRYDELINSFVIIQPGLWEYKKENGKKYFLGSYTPVSNVVEDLVIYFDRFLLLEMKLVSNSNYLGLKFTYNGNTPTQKQLDVLLQKFLTESDGWLKDLFILRDNENIELDKFSEFDGVEDLFIVAIGNYSVRYLLEIGQHNPLFMFVKHAGDGDSYAKFVVVADGNDYYISPIGTTDPIAEFNVNFSTYFNGLSVTVYRLSEITPPSGFVLVNDMYFYNGIFIALNLLVGDPVISDKYAYVVDENSVQILNLTNLPIAVEIEGITYELSPHGKYVAEEAPIGEPIGH